jgi:hypothetical protein
MGLLRRPTTGEIVEDGRFSRPCGPGAHSRVIRENQFAASPPIPLIIRSSAEALECISSTLLAIGTAGGCLAWPLPRRRRSVVPQCLVASGSGLLALHCLVGIQRPLDLPAFDLRNDLDEYGHDGAGP